MNKTRLFLLLLALVPVVAHAQADQKLINNAHQGDPKAMVLLGECYEKGAGVEVDSTMALKWFQKAANTGDGLGWVYVSHYYLTGSCGMPKDTSRYFAIRKEWAGRNVPDAIAGLGVAYELGFGTKIDTEKALELYQQSVKAGSAWGNYYMGLNYLNGDCGVAKDVKKAMTYLLKSYKMGLHFSEGILAEIYYNKNDYKNARKWSEEGMKWGDPRAYEVAAMMYWNGHGVEKDQAKAMQMMSALIAKHHNLGYAQYRTGAMYMSPDSAALRDSLKAIRIFEEGCRMDAENSSYCQLAMGDAYANAEQFDKAMGYYVAVAEKDEVNGGLGMGCYNSGKLKIQTATCSADTVAALGWWERGVKVFKDADCALLLASYYESDEARDMPKAVNYLRLADQYGDTAAIGYLGGLYERNGNYNQAIECYDTMIARGVVDFYYYKAMIYERQGDAQKCNKILLEGDKKGCPSSQTSLGMIYENGLDGQKVNFKKAESYYKKAQTPYAQYRLAMMYLTGNLGKQGAKDIALGLDYLNKSAEAGFPDAMYDLGVCYESGRFVDTVDHAKAVSLFAPLAAAEIAAGQFKMGLYYELGDGGLEADTAKSIEYYRLAAAQGHGLSMVYLGDFYRIGRGLPQNIDSAYMLYTQAHQAREEMGTYFIGRSYLEGWSVEKDTLMAIPYLKSAAAEGVGDAAYEVAEIYNFGKAGVTPNADSAVAYYFAGHNGGSGAASYFIGRQLLNEGAFDKATDYLYVGAKRGDVDAMVTYAICLQQGIGFKEADPKTAYTIFENIANNYHDSRAYQQLGVACLQGNGCTEDESLGKAYLDTAAKMDNIQAMYFLGLCYLNGYGCNADTAAAISWLERAADNENIRAINALGDVYESLEDFKNAVLYFEKAVAMGSLEGYCNLGYCYEQGQGVVLNSQKAYELYMYAAEHEYNRGYRCVAGCYMNGIYVEENPAEALKWFQKAAANGDVRAMYYCGAILEDAGDLKSARSYYKMAASQGFEPAAAALSRMK